MLHVGSDDRHFSLSISRELSIEGAAAVAIQDTHFLFNTEFNRVGDDLESDGRIHIVADHFKLENLRVPRSPDRATRSGEGAGEIFPDGSFALRAKWSWGRWRWCFGRSTSPVVIVAPPQNASRRMVWVPRRSLFQNMPMES